MTAQEALAFVRKMSGLQRQQFVETCRACGMEEVRIALLLAQEPIMAPIETMRFIIPVSKEAHQAAEDGLRAQILNALILKSRLPPAALEVDNPALKARDMEVTGCWKWPPLTGRALVRRASSRDRRASGAVGSQLEHI